MVAAWRSKWGGKASAEHRKQLGKRLHQVFAISQVDANAVVAAHIASKAVPMI